MPKAPALQWYPGDWRRDTALQTCSLAARGLWKEMLCLMFDGEPRGYLRVGGTPITQQQLARMVGPHDHERIPRLLQELEQNGVFSRDPEDGAIFNRRMARQAEISEARKAAGSLGGQFAQAKRKAKTKQTHAVAEADAEMQFEKLWHVWLKKRSKAQARTTFLKLLDAGRLPPIDRLVAITRARQTDPAWRRPHPETGEPRAFQPHLSTWLNAEGWEDQQADPRAYVDPLPDPPHDDAPPHLPS